MQEQVIKRTPPHNKEAERAVIGCMIIDREAAIIATEILDKEDFFERQYALFFEVISELINEQITVDNIVIAEKMKEKKIPNEIYSIENITSIISEVTTALNIKSYANIVKEKSTLRRLIKSIDNISQMCYSDSQKAEFVIEEAEKQIFNISKSKSSSEFENIRDIVLRAIENIEAAAKNRGGVTGIPTGFIDLDYRTAGFQNSDFILIAARPSMGKSAFMLNIAEYTAIKLGITTAIFSLEMSKEQLVKRILSTDAKVDSQALRTGNLKEEDWIKLAESAQVIGNSKLIIDDTNSISIAELRSKCRKLKIEQNLGIIIIDYLQLMTGSKKSESRQQEISDISRSLKGIARELDIPVIALSQLSRAVEQRPDKRPMLSDLRESGAIEQDADVVMFIYRDEYYNHDTEDTGIAEIIIGKQRNGPTGTIKLGWQSQYTRFVNLQLK